SATLTYYRYGSPGIYSVFDGHNFNDWIDAGSMARLSNPSSGSTSTHRWYCPGTTSWAVNDAGSLSATYWEQYKPSIAIEGLDSSHPTEVVFITTGESMNASVSNGWSDWVDVGSAVRTTESIEGGWMGDWNTGDADEWTVLSAFSATVNYKRSYNGIYILVGVLLVGTMIIGAGAFFLMRGKRKKGKSESGLPDRVG
ncbi:MAG: hypothetical protein JW753_00005, partial [Dehalococcoidia bacterium]|nr:hypothetical protein [Dehalococcoidia bacterium]